MVTAKYQQVKGVRMKKMIKWMGITSIIAILVVLSVCGILKITGNEELLYKLKDKCIKECEFDCFDA